MSAAAQVARYMAGGAGATGVHGTDSSGIVPPTRSASAQIAALFGSDRPNAQQIQAWRGSVDATPSPSTQSQPALLTTGAGGDGDGSGTLGSRPGSPAPADGADSEDDDDAARPVDLGFVVECDPAELHPVFLPSKCGGKPAWLGLEGAPSPADVQCAECGQPRSFLLQAYTGGEFDSAETFHRTVFIFVCTVPKCYRSGRRPPAAVLRSQLPRDNGIFEFDPVDYDDADDAAARYAARNAGILTPGRLAHAAVFPEFEIVTEPEPGPPAAAAGPAAEKSVSEAMAEIQRLDLPDDAKGGTVAELAELEELAGANTDAQFARFRERVTREPAQIIRYSRGGRPLWIGSGGAAESDVPPCELCGAPRRFEFQIMPQLLNHLEVEDEGAAGAASVDWGVIAVYTCERSCSPPEGGYAEEFAWFNDCDAGDSAVGKDDGSDSEDGS